MIRLSILLLAVLGVAACTREQRTTTQNTSILASTQTGKREVAYLKNLLAAANTAEDSLLVLTQAIASYADAGQSGHVDNNIWRNYTLAHKLHLCAADSVKLLCGGTADLLISAIAELTPWQAYAYNHGAPTSGLSHVTVLVRMANKLVHADPNFGYVMYDAQADTLLDFMNEIRYLENGQAAKLERKQLSFSNDFLLCADSLSVGAYADLVYDNIGAENKTDEPEIIMSNGVCPYKIKTQMTLERWLKLDEGGEPYIEWLETQEYPSIDYLVLFPINIWGAPNAQDTSFMNQYYRKLLQEIDG